MPSAEADDKLLDTSKVQYGLDDFVMYYPQNAGSGAWEGTESPSDVPVTPEFQEKQDAHLLAQLANAKAEERGCKSPMKSLDTQFALPGSEKKYRALACNAFQGRYWSVAIRGKVEPPKEIDELEQASKIQAAAFPDNETFKPRHEHLGNAATDAFFSVAELTDALYDLIFHNSLDAHGLIVIVGSTGSAKSQIMCGLLYRYLCDLMTEKVDRRPHVITVEEPLDIFKPKNISEFNPEYFRRFNLDFTPRLLYADTPTLNAALIDALRQKPSAFAIDEVRKDADWQALLDFANTGHLAITTAHAGSLDMGMNKILSAVKATRIPALRGDVGRRILGLVHIRRELYYTIEGKLVSVLVPALWRNTPRGVTALTTNGLGCIVPNISHENQAASLGRSYFVQQMLQERDTTKGVGLRDAPEGQA